ncbi:MAG: lysyl-tRNA synthetase class 2 [Gammaproteobacteria bacterium]|jgi:lysyl-tRNA synthetase class 2
MTEDNKLIAERRAKLNAIREQRIAYPNGFSPSDQAASLQAELGEQEKADLESLDRKASVAGRLMAKRGPFLAIQDVSGRIQFYVDKKGLPEELVAEIKTWDIGDIICATGPVHKSGKGDLYILMQEAQLLTKSLRPLPEKFHGLTDNETRYRQRYVDLIVNSEVRDIFKTRSRIVRYIRDFFEDRDYMEVETPMMQIIPGGATAKPFTTHHNALDLDMFLRIAPELYLKRLVVGGFERVYEINRSFRNEGLSTRHNPEFTMIEFYQAYATYKDLMDITEALFRGIANEVIGSTTIIYQGNEYDLAKPFDRLTVEEVVVKYTPQADPNKLRDRAHLLALCADLDIPVKDSYGEGKLQIEIFEKTGEHQLDQPTFITDYPAEVSPLARRNDDDAFITDRFEFFVAGREVANGFSELNDAEDQAERFRAQVAEKDAGDDEAMHFDADYIRALEHGLPPTAGEGIGIDRLVMFFTDSASIREVILFPHMRPEA